MISVQVVGLQIKLGSLRLEVPSGTVIVIFLSTAAVIELTNTRLQHSTGILVENERPHPNESALVLFLVKTFIEM